MWPRLVAAGLVAFGCSGEPQRDVVLITVDTLRPDHLGSYGYSRPTSPQIDAFFADDLIYERSYSTSASTPSSIVSSLSGLLPQDHGVRLFYQRLPSSTALLPEELPWVYRSAAFVSNVVLTEEALGIADRFHHYDDCVDRLESKRQLWEREARRTTDAALAWLHGEARTDESLFLWLHYIDPHGPYRPPDDSATRFDHEDPLPIDPARVSSYMRVPRVFRPSGATC